MFLSRIVAIFLLAISTTAMADTIDLNFRDTSAQFQYKSSMGRDALGKTEFHMGVLYANYSNQNNILADFGILVKDDVGSNAPGFSVGVGIKGLVARTMSHNDSAIALGAMGRYSPPAISRLGIVGELYISPSIVTFGDANRYFETGVRVEYEVIPQAAAYVGYRKIQLGLKTASDVTLDEGAFVGVRLSF